ncbi:MAG: hypothetical protein Q9220_004075 [cf. Caloplaca sp. 1 TL-2023]
MKTDFKFANLLGTVYCKGKLCFTPDGNSLLSPVGNRISVFNLIQNSSYTLPFAHRRNISHLALTSDGTLLLSVDEDGRAILTHLPRRLALYHFSFKAPISAVAFAPSGTHFAVGVSRFVEIWLAPSTPSPASDEGLEFAPFVRHRVYAGHHDDVQALQWSSDSRFVLSSAQDLTARVWSLRPEVGFQPTTLGGHKDTVVGAWFSKDQDEIYTISRDGALFCWQYAPLPAAEQSKPTDTDERNHSSPLAAWQIAQRHYFMQSSAKLSCAALHATSSLLVAGFSNGLCELYELPGFSKIHTLSVSQQSIDDVAINQSGEWLALGSSQLGQLLVWEWQSESYILKQQGHFDTLNDLAYSREGNRIITAADDGKIKVWDIQSGFCVVTFTEHSSGVTSCQFAHKGSVLFTASLDGSVRAWDLIRYRNFRTFSAPSRFSFSSLAVDPSGEVVCAGSLESFDVHVWSVQTGQLLDQLSGHEGPVSSLAFAPSGGNLISGGWDHTVRIWNVFDRKQSSEALRIQADVVCVAIRPDSKQVAVSTLDGQLTFWSVLEGTQSISLDSRRDISGGRKFGDRLTAAKLAGSQHFRCISYSMDGSSVIAGGNSKYICLYDVASGNLIKKFTVSVNSSLAGSQEYLNSQTLTEAGPMSLLDLHDSKPDARAKQLLPGSGRGDVSHRRTRPEVRVNALVFSPTGRSFCAASTEGLLIYSLDRSIQFDPYDLDVDVTRASTLEALVQHRYLLALVMGFRLNEDSLLQRIFDAVPSTEVERLIEQVPTAYLARLIRLVAQTTGSSPHLETNLGWITAMLSIHGKFFKDNITMFSQELRMVQKIVGSIRVDLAEVANDNGYLLDYILSQSAA